MTKCITFDKKAQGNLSDSIKAKIKVHNESIRDQKTIYISLPITDRDVFKVQKRAEHIRQQLLTKHQGCKVYTPFDLIDDSDQPYGYYMGVDIAFIIECVDLLYFVYDYRSSKGCRLEYETAKIYGKEILHETKDYIISRLLNFEIIVLNGIEIAPFCMDAENVYCATSNDPNLALSIEKVCEAFEDGTCKFLNDEY